MRKVLRLRPSASMVVAVAALVIAASGGAVAATTLVRGDTLIAKHSLSGNRLRNHTITGTQINLRKLGTVPGAVNALNAVNADDAATAGNANALGGQPPSAFEPASDFIRTGLVTASSGQTIALASFGPFTLTLVCNDKGGQNVEAEIDATSTEANSDGYGTPMAFVNAAYDVLDTNVHGTTFAETNDNVANFFTPSGQTYIADLTLGQNYLGAPCFANALISPS